MLYHIIVFIICLTIFSLTINLSYILFFYTSLMVSFIFCYCPMSQTQTLFLYKVWNFTIYTWFFFFFPIESAEQYIEAQKELMTKAELASTCWAHITTEEACAEADSRHSQKSSSHESVCVWAYRGTYESWQRERERQKSAETNTEDKQSVVRCTLVPHSRGDSQIVSSSEVGMNLK